MPLSLLDVSDLLYAAIISYVFGWRAVDSTLLLRCCSLFPQEGCARAANARVGQDRSTNFGVCEPAPVRRASVYRLVSR